MARFTAIVLAHKRLALLAWPVIAVAGFATVGKSSTIRRKRATLPVLALAAVCIGAPDLRMRIARIT